MSHFVLLGKHSISISRRDGQAMRVLKRDEESGAYLRLFYTVFTAISYRITAISYRITAILHRL